MGLESVEFILAVEERFGIEITDEQAIALKTIGELRDCVGRVLGRKFARGCHTSRTFYQLRRALIEVLRVPRGAIRPETRLEAILPLKMRRSRWAELSRRSDLHLPSLGLPRHLMATVLALSLMIVILLAIMSGGFVVLLLLPFVFFGALALSEPLSRYFPAQIVTVGDLTRSALHFDLPVRGEARPSDAEVLRAINEILAQHVGVSTDALAEDTRFHEDLGF